MGPRSYYVIRHSSSPVHMSEWLVVSYKGINKFLDMQEV